MVHSQTRCVPVRCDVRDISNTLTTCATITDSPPRNRVRGLTQPDSKVHGRFSRQYCPRHITQASINERLKSLWVPSVEHVVDRVITDANLIAAARDTYEGSVVQRLLRAVQK